MYSHLTNTLITTQNPYALVHLVYIDTYNLELKAEISNIAKSFGDTVL